MLALGAIAGVQHRTVECNFPLVDLSIGVPSAMNNWLGTVSLCSVSLCSIIVLGCDSASVPTAASSPSRGDSRAAVDAVSNPNGLATKPFDRENAIELTHKLMSEGKHQTAIAELRRVLSMNPEDTEAFFLMARIQADSGDLVAAVELLDLIPEDDPDAGLPALGQAADWYMALEQYGEAETRYKKVLSRADGFSVAHRQLAYLYNRQGRRHEAAVHLRVLCRLGNIQQDELHALMVLSHAIFDDPSNPPPNHRPYYPIGPAATARILFTASRYAEAVEALDEAVQTGQAVPSVMAFYGLLAVELQDAERFEWWLSRADEPVQQFSEYWAAIGAHLLSQRHFEQAVRAFAEALDRDPTDIASMRRINQALAALGKHEEAERWIDRYVIQRDTTLASNSIGGLSSAMADSYPAVAEGLDQLHRPLEAMTWRLFEAFHRKASGEEIDTINQLRSDLARSETSFPNRSDRLCGMDASVYPMPTLERREKSIASFPPPRSSELQSYPVPRFENVAPQIGLNHEYQIATQPQPYRFALYQSLGGGIAVLDYDLDGLFDLYLAQGGADPPDMVGDQTNSLYRNSGGRFSDVTESAGATDFRYSVGVTSGDWNQDGFDDIVFANLGNKVLLINNGDGTFRRSEFDKDPGYEVLTSSIAIADVTGDALPDIVAIHYVEDEAMIRRPEMDGNGQVLTISPASFQPGIDRIKVNDGRGGMTSMKVSESTMAASTGLGMVIANWDGKPGNEIFVGNDIRPNHLWVRGQDGSQWVDTAVISGCAHGHGGMATASMGIAVADFDGNGTRDIHITNFYLEPVSLFMNRGTTFEDRCVQYKLHRDSSKVLGFGCQAIDYNNDGRPDLAVTNGNIEKAPGEPLKQSPQFFVNLGNEFRLSDVDDPSGYWQGEYLGRCMARLDFNNDGKQDFLITHLGAPSALLANQTETGNHWLIVQLVGVQSERGAVGAQVDVHAGGKVWTNWIVGGDGYLCRNEPTISFGLADVTNVDKLVVTWPTGEKQTFQGVATDQHLLFIESLPQAFIQTAL